MKLARLAGAGLIASGIQVARVTLVRAAERRLCIAPSNQEHIYMTAPFPASIAMEAPGSAFHLALTRESHRHLSVQCPTGRMSSAMRQHAGEFNRQMGVDWRPAAGRLKPDDFSSIRPLALAYRWSRTAAGARQAFSENRYPPGEFAGHAWRCGVV